jgi:2-oxoglutarate dehydrogenase E1 component
MCAQDNMQVVNCTTPANFFHALRRQLKRNFRKPLVVMAPKSMLRHKLVVSDLADFGPGSRFRRVLGEVDKIADGKKVSRVVLSSGKVYYDLLEKRRELKLKDVALVRVEQLYPWPRRHAPPRIHQRRRSRRAGGAPADLRGPARVRIARDRLPARP